MITNIIFHSFRGLAGAIFLTLVAAAIVYVIGYATVAWRIKDGLSSGLWQQCRCSGIEMPEDDKGIE